MQYPGKAPPPFVEPHRLTPDDAPRHHGLAPIDAATIAALRAIGRRPPPRDRVRFTLALAAALAFHVVLVFFVGYEMQPRRLVDFAAPDDTPDVLEVRFIEPPSAAAVANVPPPPPVVSPPPKVRSSEATRPEPPRPKPAEPEQAPPSEAPPAHPAIFGADGSIAAPVQSVGHAATQADFVARKPTDDAHIMSRKNPVTYKETRFEKDWAPRDENALSGGMRRALEKSTLKKTFDLGHGVRVNCATVLFVLPAGCSGEDPSKASAKDGDARLNMAPAKPLSADPDPPAAPSEAQCIAAYRRDERVMEGCPSDTPLKAMDQENAERSRRTGG